tara:strand:+ start:640 stop:807 length:168 start_codon:yes stop_codon:yes gene_type:complete
MKKTRGRPKKIKEDPNEQLGKAIYSGSFMTKEHPKVKKERLKFFQWLEQKLASWT